MYEFLDNYNMYKNTYRRSWPYEIDENINTSYGYLADDLESDFGYGMKTPNWYNQIRVGNMNSRDNIENIEEMYPEIYKIIYPMVKKACNRNIRTINKNLIDELTEEIYSNLETNNEVRLNINIENIEGEENRKIREVKEEEIQYIENRGKEHRNRKKGTLFDLIKILLIRELLDRHSGHRPRHHRPPMPPRPGDWHDTFPGRPPMPRY